jgi:hypothetical protein
LKSLWLDSDQATHIEIGLPRERRSNCIHDDGIIPEARALKKPVRTRQPELIRRSGCGVYEAIDIHPVNIISLDPGVSVGMAADTQ